MSYLKLHQTWVKKGRMPAYGLCVYFNEGSVGDLMFEFFKPTYNDIVDLRVEGLNTLYWGSGRERGCVFGYTPLRQNIVLFMAAMNGEL